MVDTTGNEVKQDIIIVDYFNNIDFHTDFSNFLETTWLPHHGLSEADLDHPRKLEAVKAFIKSKPGAQHFPFQPT